HSAAEAAAALRPVAGSLAGFLFAIGVVAVGFLAVPIMTAGAAYDLAQTVGWPSTLHARPGDAPRFYAAIIVFTAGAVAINFAEATAGNLRFVRARRLEAGGFAPPSEGVRPKAYYVA